METNRIKSMLDPTSSQKSKPPVSCYDVVPFVVPCADIYRQLRLFVPKLLDLLDVNSDT